MQCPFKSCQQHGCQCLKNYGLFSLVLLATIGLWLFNWNQKLFYIINSWHTILPNQVWEWINIITYSKYFILAGILLIVTAIWRRAQLIRVVILIVAFYVIFYVLKIIIGYPRPYVILDSSTFFWLNTHGDYVKVAYKSFPSGHVGNVAVFIFALNSLFFANRWWIRGALFLLLIITALARICTGWHWPIDVLASGLIAYLLVRICLNFKNTSYSKMCR